MPSSPASPASPSLPSPPLPRDQFPVVEQFRYFNHAGIAPLSRAAADAGRAFLDDFVARGAVGFLEWEARMDAVRPLAAGLLGVPPTDIAFVKNTTEGLSFVANGLDWSPGDRVLVPDRDFPSTVYPWLALRERGVQVDLLDPVGPGWTLPLELFATELARQPTRLVAVSWVHFARGWRIDLASLARLCHDYGALLCVDAIQGLGVIPASFAEWGVDFAAADSHKWLLGPVGTGVFYVSAACRDQLRPQEPGWASVAHREQWDNLALIYHDSARRFEGGSHTIETILEMGASMQLLTTAGVDAVWRHVDGLLDHAAGGLDEAGAVVLSDRSPGGRSANLTFAVPGWDADALWPRLEQRGIVCSPRGGGIRIAPHGYNTIDEIDVLLDEIRSLPATT